MDGYSVRPRWRITRAWAQGRAGTIFDRLNGVSKARSNKKRFKPRIDTDTPSVGTSLRGFFGRKEHVERYEI